VNLESGTEPAGFVIDDLFCNIENNTKCNEIVVLLAKKNAMRGEQKMCPG
jgi:hypothetical protein